MTNANSRESLAMQRAIGLLRAGKTVEAEEVMQNAARAAEAKFGPTDPVTAGAYDELGTILMSVEDVKGAVQAYRRACAGPMPTEKQALRDRLTCLMNLGTALQTTNQLDEAEKVLRQGCDARRAHYGADHAGYAFGLEPLGALLMRRGKLQEALEVLETAVENFWRNGHPNVAGALALRAEAFRASGREDSPFEGSEQLPEDILARITTEVAARSGETDAGILSGVLQDLVVVLKQRFGPDHALVIDAQIQIANLESTRGPHCDFAVRLRVTREVLDTYDRQRKRKEAIQTLQGLALALAEAGRTEEAIETYREALNRAERLGALALKAQLRRNFGLLLSELERDGEAEVELAGAVENARSSTDMELLSRAQIALGIFYQHRRRLKEAQPLLETALRSINPAHPDAVTAGSHLKAVLSGGGCGCGDTGDALAAAFREFVLGRLPEDLLENLDVRLKDNDFKLRVQLKRKPTDEEREHLDRIINHALAEFRRKVEERS